jgi:hypothetical protein
MLHYEINVINSKASKSSGRNLVPYLFIKRMINLTAVIIK